jgi:hypothetical protein
LLGLLFVLEDVIHSPEISADFYQTTRRYNPEYRIASILHGQRISQQKPESFARCLLIVGLLLSLLFTLKMKMIYSSETELKLKHSFIHSFINIP